MYLKVPPLTLILYYAHSAFSSYRSEIEKTTHAAELEGKQQELEIQAATIAKCESEIQHLKTQVTQTVGLIITISLYRLSGCLSHIE